MPEERPVVDPDAERPWLRWYDEDVPADVEVPDRSFAELLDLAAERWPGSPALCHLGRELTYRELRHDVEQFSTALARLGVEPGDRVGLVLPNSPQLVIGLFAVIRLGAVAVPLSPACPAPVLTGALVDAEAGVVVCTDRALEQVTAARQDAETSIREIVVTLTTDYLPALDRIALAVPSRTGRRERARASASVPPGAGVRLWSEELRRARGLPVPAPGPDELSPSEDPAVISYPATGPVLGRVWTSRNLRAAGAQAAAWLTNARLGRESLLVGLPLGSPEGLAVCLGAGTMLGAALQLGTRTSVDAGSAPAAGVRPTVAVGPPAFLGELLEPTASDAAIDLRSLRLCVTGPELLEPGVGARWAATSGAAVVDGVSVVGAPVLLGRPVRGGRPQGDGSAAAPVPTSSQPRTAVPLPSTEVRIVDAAGTPLPPGSPGRLEVRGPQVFAGIWRRPEQTAAILHDGWLVTGLTGCLHPDGQLELVPS